VGDDIQSILERLERLEKKVFRGEGQKTEGSEVWTSYSYAYLHRYGVEPVRNAKMSSLCKTLVQRVGKDDAVELVRFYLDQRDAFFVMNCHPLGTLIAQAEGLVTRMRTGLRVTRKQAEVIDEGDSNAQASLAYLRKTT